MFALVSYVRLDPSVFGGAPSSAFTPATQGVYMTCVSSPLSQRANISDAVKTFVTDPRQYTLAGETASAA